MTFLTIFPILLLQPFYPDFPDKDIYIMFEIFVDSAANIPAELVKKFKIKVLSFVNLVNGKRSDLF